MGAPYGCTADERTRSARRTNRLICEKASLLQALERTKAALVLLSPALNVMARECLADIIAREIDATLSQHKRGGA